MEGLLKELVGGGKVLLSIVNNMNSEFNVGDRVVFDDGDEGTVIGYGEIPIPSFAAQRRCIPSNGQYTLCFGRCMAVFIALDKHNGLVSHFCRYGKPKLINKKEDV
ncbi:MAG TPA: hypothetical protein P5052_01970 [Candidatus Paceibacterota bacterium]|nr:hypothetical protein [Candidatus Paceibacterota bacterium]HRZ29522.1 hypothetical protein [Candidatus Paceibacterota bacterium]